MATSSSNSNTTSASSASPAPEQLKPQSDTKASASEGGSSAATPKPTPRPRHGSYRPSHRATFIGLATVVAILGVNAGVIAYIMRGKDAAKSGLNREEVTISPAALNSVGVSRNAVGNQGAELVVAPNSRFKGTVTVGSDVSIAGQLSLNSRLTASDASLTRLEAGDTTLSTLNVSGNGSVSNMSLRRDLTVAGITQLQGPVTMNQLVTLNNSLNVAGNLAVGGVLSARGFQASTLTSDTTLIVGGHIITRGNAPGVSPGPALGSNGTVSISGSDTAGTVGTNLGGGGGNGILARVTFRQPYGNIPRVMVTAVGRGLGSLYVTRSPTGFEIGVNGAVSPGGYAVDYIVIQ